MPFASLPCPFDRQHYGVAAALRRHSSTRHALVFPSPIWGRCALLHCLEPSLVPQWPPVSQHPDQTLSPPLSTMYYVHAYYVHGHVLFYPLVEHAIRTRPERALWTRHFSSYISRQPHSLILCHLRVSCLPDPHPRLACPLGPLLSVHEHVAAAFSG